MLLKLLSSPRFRSLLIALGLCCALMVCTGCDDANWYVDPEEDADEFSSGNTDPAPSTDEPTQTPDNDDKVTMQEGDIALVPGGSSYTVVENPNNTETEPATDIEKVPASDTEKTPDPEEDKETGQPTGDSHTHQWTAELTSVPTYGNETVTTWICQSCDYSTQNQAEAEAHGLTHGAYSASTVTLPLAELWRLQCGSCDFLCDTEAELNAHHAANSGAEAHGCESGIVDYEAGETITTYTCECNYSTTVEAEMTTHVNATGGPNVTTTQVEAYGVGCACGAQFGRDGYDALEAHEADNCGSYNFDQYPDGYEDVLACGTCGEFADGDTLYCDCPGLPQHSFDPIVTTGDPIPVYGYICTVCSEEFADETDAAAHEAANPGSTGHTGSSRVNVNAGKTQDVNGFVCDNCGFFTENEQEIKAHCATHQSFTTTTEVITTITGYENVPTGWEYCSEPGCNERREATDP